MKVVIYIHLEVAWLTGLFPVILLSKTSYAVQMQTKASL